MTLPDIPRLYTALAEVLAVLVYAQAAPPRAAKPVTYAATAGWAAVLGVFLQLTGSVPLAWWLPCMVAAIVWLYLYLWGTREMNLLEAGYSCARAFILAELAASVEWQLHCVLWPQQRATAPLSVLLLAAVYTTVYGFLYWFERRHAAPTRLTITAAATLMAVVMAVTAFAVSNLSFISDNGVTMSVMSIFYIRTLVDMAGVLILTVQHEQLREAAKLSVCKINIDSDLRLAMTGTVRAFLDEHPDKFDPREYLKPARANIKELVRHKLVDVLGCAGKA